MNSLLITGLYSLIFSAILFLFYKLALKNLNFLIINRLYLLFTSTSPLLFFLIPSYSMTGFNPIIYSSALLPEILISAQNTLFSPGQNLAAPYMPWIIYGLISALLFTKSIWHLLPLLNLYRKSIIIKKDNFKIARHSLNYSPFSFFRVIFINASALDKKSEKTIIEHELIHIRQWHSIDLLINEWMTVIFWFNPVQWLLKKEISLNHEYLADHNILKNNSIHIADYQSTILSQMLGIPPGILSPINNSSTLKRFKMMTTAKSPKWHLLKLGLILPILYLAMLVKANTDYSSYTTPYLLTDTIKSTEVPGSDTIQLSGDGETFTTVEKMPEFSKGGDKGLMEYIAKTVKYPETARKAGASAKIFVQFVINHEGKVEAVETIRSSAHMINANHEVVNYDAKEFEEESIRVVKSLPSFTPGYQRGKAVKVKMILPINFKLD